VVLSWLIPLIEFLATPSVRFYGTFFGLYHGAVYDEDVFVAAPYLWLRCFDAAFVVFLLLLAELLESRKAGRAGPCRKAAPYMLAETGEHAVQSAECKMQSAKWPRAAGSATIDHRPSSIAHGCRSTRLCLIVVALATVGLGLLGPKLGFVASGGPLEEELSGRVETPRFLLRFKPGGPAAEAAPLLAADLEFRASQIERVFGLEGGDSRVNVYLYDGPAHKQLLMGAGRTSIAKPWRRELHVHLHEAGNPTLAHELAHVMLAPTAGAWLGIPMAGPLTPRAGLMEGAAVAIERGGSLLTTHQWARAMRDIDRIPDLTAILEGASFWGEAAPRAYMACGSFVRFLLERDGPRPFARVYAGDSFASAYGKELPTLLDEWKAFLDTVPLASGDLELAELLFSRPSFFEKACPNAGGRCLARAALAARRGLGDEILPLANLALHLTSDAVTLGPRFAALLLAVDRVEEAEELLRRLAAEADGGGAAAAESLRLSAADAKWLRGESAIAREEYEAMLSRPAGRWFSPGLRFRLALLREGADRIPRDLVRLACGAYTVREGKELAAGLLAGASTLPPAGRLVLGVGLGRFPAFMEAGAELIRVALPEIGGADSQLIMAATAALARALLLTGRTAEAGELLDELVALGSSSAGKLEELRDWRERAEWRLGLAPSPN
jgi:hypothetical protein